MHPLEWLTTPEGCALLARAEALPADRLTRITRLRKTQSVEIASAVVELLELRKRARTKYADADNMLFTSTGLEQCTGEAIANYRASRYPLGGAILDVCSGIGGDARALAHRASVFAVDRELDCAICTRENSRRSPYPVRTLCADVSHLDLKQLVDAGVSAAFFDPSRRVERSDGTDRRARDSKEYSPPLHFLDTLRAVIPFTAAKVSPMADDQTLLSFNGSVEFLSYHGECREAILWPEAAAHANTLRSYEEEPLYTATIIDRAQTSHTLLPSEGWRDNVHFALDGPLEWIFEPDPAVVRAHLTGVLAERLEADRLDQESYYLTSSSPLETPFATTFQVCDWMPLKPTEVQKRCLQLGMHITAIKTRWSPIQPESLIKKITGAKSGEPATVIITSFLGKAIALICRVIRPTV